MGSEERGGVDRRVSQSKLKVAEGEGVKESGTESL